MPAQASHGMAQFLVVSPSTGDNSLGRALCVATVFEHLGPVAVAAAEHQGTWPGAVSWDLSVTRFSSPRELLRLAAERSRPQGPPLVVVAVKPLPTSLGAALAVRAVLRRRRRPVRLIADLDEDDVALRTAALRYGSRRDRLRRNVDTLRDIHVGHPVLVRPLQKLAVPRADAISVSSWEVARALVRGASAPVMRIPHARAARAYAAPRRSDRLRLGFLGTPRGYKGVGLLSELLEVLPDAELHLLGDRVPTALKDLPPGRLRMHATGSRDSLERAFAEVDVIVLPQDPHADQTKLQLPAKLIDALMFGRPVVATATPPILEVGGAHVRSVSSWSPLDDAVSALTGLRDPDVRERLGRAANEYARQTLSTTSVATQVGDVVRRLIDGGR